MSNYKLMLYVLGWLMITSNVQAQETLSLEDCRAMALSHNRDLKTAALKIQEAEANYKLAKKAYLPSIEGSATGIMMPTLELDLFPGMSIPGGPSIPAIGVDKPSILTAGVFAVQPVYTGGKIKAVNAQAKLGKEMSQENYKLTYAQLVEKTDEAYWNVIAAKEGVKLTKTYVEMLDSLESQMDLMYSEGLLPLSEKLKVSVQKNQAELEQVKAENQVKLAKLFLSQIIGVEDESQFDFFDQLDFNEQQYNIQEGVETGLSQRSEIKLLENQVQISVLEQKSTKADYLPQVGVMAGGAYIYGNNGLDNIDPIGVVGGAVKIPIFHFKESKEKMTVARLKTQEAIHQKDNATEMISIEIRQIGYQLDENKRSIAIAQENIEQAEESLEETKVSFSSGLNTTTDVLQSQSELLKMQFELILALKNHEVLKTKWLRATGQIENPPIN
ncbi:TolC family protein [Flammeovirga yaeyamensis]|uniref:TolC family protein n=1 Tax=Flammeovirga yaeyamensis TaxID=367791 RepID=A0AAX1N9G5_9BACT|nr:TolC family protein [Flammeovirga yaeyamensis]MBB3697443.1 outer membrane protein TolC [Flammeovirga yaeyamensis]NMF36137.1 TolC family protein [Flammeovirga yaeyamensis]QWG02870.1 TolC family protein [Flammeovirga yaeyamensis]